MAYDEIRRVFKVTIRGYSYERVEYVLAIDDTKARQIAVNRALGDGLNPRLQIYCEIIMSAENLLAEEVD